MIEKLKNLMKTKKRLLFFGVGLLSFAIMIAMASIALAFIHVLLNQYKFDAYTISFIALTVLALVFTVVLVVNFYLMARKSQLLIDSLNRVASGDYSTEITYGRTDTFAGVYKNFNKMTEELNSVKTMRESFLHDFSHEMKTPLFSIQGFANLLLEGGLSEEEQKRFLQIISDEAGRLHRLADSTLTMAKLENQQMLGERKPVRVDLDITDCIIMLEREWEQKNIEISSELASVTVEGDAAMLRQVWLNVLSNAVKFTPEGGKIEVSLKRVGDSAVAVFRDGGCGISPTDMPHIFEKYYRSASAKDVEGNGLGLAICKRICTLAGGDITAESGEGGSTFTITLPL